MLLPLMQISLNRVIKSAKGDLLQVLNAQEVADLVHSLSFRKIQDKNLWSIGIKTMSQWLNEPNSYSLSDICIIVKDLKIAKLNAPNLINSIVTYIEKSDENLQSKNVSSRDRIRLVISLFQMNGQIDSIRFLDMVEQMILKQIHAMEKDELEHLLDIFKYSEHFQSRILKDMICDRLDQTMQQPVSCSTGGPI